MIMKCLAVEISPILDDFGGEYLIRHPPSRGSVYIERRIYKHSIVKLTARSDGVLAHYGVFVL